MYRYIECILPEYLALYYNKASKDAQWLDEIQPITDVALCSYTPLLFAADPVQMFGTVTRIRTTERIASYIGGVVDPELSIHIRDALREIFYAEFITFLNTRLASFSCRYMGINDAILDFMELYNIGEDDLAFESLKKRYYRYRLRTRQIAPKNTQLKLFS